MTAELIARLREMGDWKPVFGYRSVSQIPPCPCNDPGNYVYMEESTTNPLKFRLTCWCGRKVEGQFDTEGERATFLKANEALE